MKAHLYIDNDKIGEVFFSIIDESMAGIGGQLIESDNYQKYKRLIQQHCEKKGISNIDDLGYRIILSDNSEVKAEGGIGITDFEECDEIYVESAGLDEVTLNKMRNNL